MKVHLNSIGCRLNHSEIESMARQLLASGHEIVPDPTTADAIVINTCAVTAEAAKDARTMTRRVHRANAAAEIILTGCYATVAPQELARVKGAGRIVANNDKRRLVRLIDPQAPAELAVYDKEPILRDFLAGPTSLTRAFVKVQDGCDNCCTFCVTTIARGKGRSRPLAEVVAEVQALAAAGYQEAVLTGVHLGSYGRDLANGACLRTLVAAILDLTEIPRLRLSSLEPWDIAPGFFELWENSRLLPHLHVPLQSGSDKILRRMARRMTRASFRDLAAAARNCIPDLNLSTDLIVGFPGETERDFQDSLEFVAEIEFSRLHVFTYSKRPGTAAAKMDGHLPKQVKKDRGRQMIDLGKKLSLTFHRRYEGQSAQVLWESAAGADSGGLRWAGYTENYIRVMANGPDDLFNRITCTRLSCASPEGMSGRILPDNSPPTDH